MQYRWGQMHTGACLCGAVRFEVAGELPPPDACHCTRCRKFSGHVFASTDVPRASVTVHGAEHVGWFRSSEKVRRGFCSRCGSSLFWDPIQHDWIGIAMGAFDPPTGTKLKIHIFTDDKGDYYPIDDGVPRGVLRVRGARAEDVPGLLEVVGKCIEAMRAAGIDQWDDVYPDRATLESDLARGELFVAQSEYGLLGCVVLNTVQEPEYAAVPWRIADAPVAVLHRLMVHPKAQGKGVAKRLMEFAETRARELGFRAIRLDAFRANARALRFYEGLRYQRAGQVRFRKGEFDCFEKRLDA